MTKLDDVDPSPMLDNSTSVTTVSHDDTCKINTAIHLKVPNNLPSLICCWFIDCIDVQGNSMYLLLTVTIVICVTKNKENIA